MSYWNRRKNTHTYYSVVDGLIHALGGPNKHIIDIGCADTPLVTYGDYRTRTTVDLKERPPLSGVEAYVGDFLEWDTNNIHYDVAICTQVIEHLPSVKLLRFMWKLFRISEHQIISIPYMWPAGKNPGHIQDPVNMRLVMDWAQDREPVYSRLVRDGTMDRMVMLFGEPLPIEVLA